MRIDENGKVGIGVTNPSTALQVSGTITGTTFSGALSGNATTATTLQTTRAIALSGDASGTVNFDGSAGVTISATLATVNSNTGSFGSSVAIPVVTVNGKGLVTAVSTIAPKIDSLNDTTAVGATTSSAITINNTTQSTGSTTGALIISGGLGVAKDTYIAGQLTIGGTLNVGGTLITTGVSTLIVDDSIIYMAENNSGNVVDIGIVGAFNNGTYQHTGLVRRATDGKWYLFSGVTYEPTATVNFSNYAVDTIKANLEGNVTGNASSATNIGGGATGSIPYQSGATTTAFVAAGTSGTFFKSQGTAAPIWSSVSKADVGLSNVENTALSTWSGSTYITTIGTISSPSFTGIPLVPTAAANTNTTQIASTAFVLGQASSSNPLMNGTVSAGTSTRFSRADHVHASDTTKLSLTGGSLGGQLQSTVAQGTAPFIVESSTLVSNLNAELLSGQTTGYYLNYNNLTNKPTIPTVNDAVITLTTTGTGLSGSATFSLNQAGTTTFTVTSNATFANTASTIVARDASGNFTAGNITAATFSGTLSGNITGNAATVTNGLYSTGAYSNPSWLTGLSWSKILGTPTTLSGYGITDALSATNAILKRVDSATEGGQINFNRPSDDTMYWALDTYGTSTAPSFRLLETTNLRLQIDPGGAFKFNGSAGSSGQVLTSQGTSSTPIWTTVSGGGSGSVTSVDMTVPSILAVSGNPITSAGTFALSLANQNANLVFAGPSTGAATTPAFRSLVAADIPNLGSSYLSLSGGTLTGRLVISSGGASITGGITSISDISVNGVNIGAGPSTNAYNTKIGVSALNGISTGTYNIAIGYQALYGTTTASDIVAIGKNALYSATNTVSGIVAIGASALTANTSGINNVAIGYQTLKANTSGNYNTALGYNAVSSTTTSAQQTGIGSRSLQNNTGSGNTAVGEGTISATGAGSNNSALGVSALAANTSGINNTGIGSISLNANTTGSYNVAIGRSALAGSTSTSYNIAIGYNSLSGVTNTVSNLVAIGQSTLALNTTGTNNTAIGDQALSANLDGYSNIAIGNSALKVNTTGSNNTVIGHQAGFNITTGSSNTIIGMLAGVTNISDTVLIGAGTTERLRIDSNGNVGIGISSPTGDDKAIHIHGTTASSIHLTNSTTGTALGDGSDITAYGSDFIIRNREVGSILFRTQNADMANIDSVGNFTINSQNYSSGALSIGTGSATGTQYIKLRTSDSEAHITYTNGDGSTSGVKFQDFSAATIPITVKSVNITSAPTGASHAVTKSYADNIMAIAWLGL